MDPTHLHAANTEMENQNSTSYPTAAANLPDQTQGAVQANNVTSNTIGLNVGGDFVAGGDVSININSSGSTTKNIKKIHPFRFNIPVPNKHFKGREGILEDVKAFFKNVPADTSDFCDRMVVIAGCGGMGKTETAYKVAAGFGDFFPSMAWINAETEDSLRKSFLGLAEELGVDSNASNMPVTDLVKKVYKYIDLNDYGNVLFIFDNAIRFNSSSGKFGINSSSSESAFGIYDYLLTETLINKRYPYILITTQTHEWGKQTKVLQVHGLSEKDSLEFFRSSFRVNSLECDDEFKRLHKVTEGYPLVMNLAASNIDYNRHTNDGSVRELKQKINLYIEDLEQSKKILTEEMEQWPTKYKKTLSAAWQLTFQRLEQEANGPKALEVLQIMSFLELPIHSENVTDILTLRAARPQPYNMELQLKELLYLLERFYAARILHVTWDYPDGFRCHVGIHRLVQLAVREQTNCSQVLEEVFCNEILHRNFFMRGVYPAALNDAMKRADLPPRALASVGIFACAGDPIARLIVQTSKPETKAAETVWRLYHLERGITTLNAGSVQVLTELIELAKSAKMPGVHFMYSLIALHLLNNQALFENVRKNRMKFQNFFDLRSLHGIEKPACELILDFVSFVQFRRGSCQWIDRLKHPFVLVRKLLTKLIKDFVHADAEQSESIRRHLTHAFLAYFPLLKQKNEWAVFWVEVNELDYSQPVYQSRMAELRTSLWDYGLAEKLEHVFHCFHYMEWYGDEQFSCARCMGFCLDGMDFKDRRVQKVMSAFTEMTARVLSGIIRSRNETAYFKAEITCLLVCDVCSFWILLLLMSQPPKYLFKFLSRCEALTYLEGHVADSFSFQRSWIRSSFRISYQAKFSRFIEIYSSSKVKRIQTLVAFCRMLQKS